MNTPVTVGLIQEAVTSDASANVERAVEDLRAIVLAERCRVRS